MKFIDFARNSPYSQLNDVKLLLDKSAFNAVTTAAMIYGVMRFTSTMDDFEEFSAVRG